MLHLKNNHKNNKRESTVSPRKMKKTTVVLFSFLSEMDGFPSKPDCCIISLGVIMNEKSTVFSVAADT